jgi:Peptidase family C25/Propeptide_C25/Dockerin type I domain/Peptidase family C25, C terminal ig-like domain
MRNRLLIALFLFLFVGSALSAEHVNLGEFDKGTKVEVLQSNDQSTVVKYEIGGFEQETVNINGEEFFMIRLAGENFLLNEGEPELPRLCRSIIIPDDAAMEINVVASEYTDIHGMQVIPSKGNLLRNVNPDDVPYTFGETYNNNAFYPGELAAIRDPFIIRDYRGTVIELNAFQYNPVTQTLRVFTSVTVEVANVGYGQINVKQATDHSRIVSDFKLFYDHHFINYAQFESLKYTPVEETGDMLIITYDAFNATMQPFVDWKMQKGIKTTMVNVSTIGNNAAAIDSYIQTFYDDPNTNLGFVLLVGDGDEVTPHYANGDSDVEYTKVVGTDDYPDIIIGRFSAELISQVQTQVDRTLTYEKNPVPGDWFHKATGVASNEGAGNGHYGEADNVHMGYIRDDFLAGPYTHVDEIYQPSATSAMVTTALNEGRSYVNYCGHGSTTAWTTTGYNNSNVNSLTNDNMLPVIVSVSCVTGDFNGNTCFAEAWMRATNGSNPTGAIAVWTATINQSWAPPMYAQDEAVDLLMAETRTTFGGICLNGGAWMIQESGDIAMSDTWVIFGDPSLQCRTDVPAAMTVNYVPAVFFNVPTYDVEVVGEEGALCALYSNGVLYGSGYTDAGGMATITMDQALPIGEAVTLTVTAYNKEMFEGTVQTTSDLAIVHTPLPDTKDTLNDYTIDVTCYSSAAIVADQMFMHYDVGGGYTSVLMDPVRIVEASFTADIPAQAAGTVVNYYMTAKNEDEFYDTTDVYSFNVLDYEMILEPDVATTTAPAYDTAWYDLRVTNDGVLADDYGLAVSGNVWETTIWDAAMSSQISSSGTLVGDAYIDFKVRVIIPSTLEGQSDEVTLTASSTGDLSLFMTSVMTTVSAGQPWPIPFTEYFQSTTFDMTKWESVDEATINDIGIDEPTAPYSVDLNGESTGGDIIETEAINLRNESNIIVKYYYQQTGGAESPDADDDLYCEYLNQDSSWIQLNRHFGADPDMTTFEEVELTVPGDGMHANFRLRFRCTATAGAYDDWFVDDIFVGHPSDYDVMIAPAFQSEFGPAGDSAVFTVTVINKGFLDDEFDLTYTGDWDAVFFNESGAAQSSTTGVVSGGDSVNVMAKVAVPAGTPLHVAKTITVTATSQGDNNMSSYAMLETISAGFPAEIPWSEVFPEDTLHTTKWFTFVGTQVSTGCSNPPSAPYAIALNSDTDVLTSQLIDLSEQDGVLLSYYFERGGNMDKPDAGDDLTVEYRNSSGSWVELITHAGAELAMTEFEYVSLELPTDANHSSMQIRLTSIGGGAAEDYWFVDDIRLDYPPIATTTPGSFSHTLVQGETAQSELVLENTGAGGLLYTVELAPHNRIANPLTKYIASGDIEAPSHEYPDYVYNQDVPKGTDIDYQGVPVRYDRGGPDTYGYYWFDSDDPSGPSFDWIDISSTGTDILDTIVDDYTYGPFDIGFVFSFYGVMYDQVYISSNGYVGFTAAGMSSTTSRPIPTSYEPNAILALLFDDLNPADLDNPGAHIYIETIGDEFIISYLDYPEYHGDPGDIFSGQVILRADGSIKYQYQSFAAGFDLLNCTVGIENQNGDDGLEVTYHAAYLHNTLAIEFFKPYEWLTIDKFEGEILPGETDLINCTFSTTLEFEPGIYNTDIIISCNDPDNSSVIIGAELEVVGYQAYICGDANDSGGVDVSDAVHIINYVFVDGSAPDPLESADVNCDGDVNVSDGVFIINYVFVGGFAPCDSDGDGLPDC